MADDVPLREYVEALLEAERRIANVRHQLADERYAGLSRRLEESAHDRERIRNSLGGFVPRTEYDRAQESTQGRLGALERSLARIAGALAVVVLLASILGVLLRYLVG